ncbi:MAG TPA: hypothetical protein VN922_06305 [Bacteroidia bacterium]|nr:hypothetical protein [Bacteroidia bacterium]
MKNGTKNEELRTKSYTLRVKSVLLYSSLLVLSSSFFQNASAQTDSTKHAPKFTVNGYIKYLEQVSFAGSATDLLTNDLLHNRLNFRYQPNAHFNFRLEVRNRLYYGELVQDYPGFASLETSSTGPIDLSKNWVSQNAVLLNSTIDRASAEYLNGKWDITIGRQRINWGISTVWTPNDVFNAFNYFDFDYEERPGSDAARIQYAFTSSSSLDLAVSPGKTASQNIEALMYHFNKFNYDFQVFSGIYRQDFTAGAGWAGNIKDAGFKGEVSYFTPYRHFSDSGAIAASISFDYGFKNGLYVLVSGLYNGLGSDSIPFIAQLTSETLSAKDIFPFKYTVFAEASYSFTPIFKASLGGMYSPAGNAFILLPTVTYSIADNWALDLIWQSFYSEQGSSYRPLSTSIYIRIKWGF